MMAGRREREQVEQRPDHCDGDDSEVGESSTRIRRKQGDGAEGAMRRTGLRVGPLRALYSEFPPFPPDPAGRIRPAAAARAADWDEIPARCPVRVREAGSAHRFGSAPDPDRVAALIGPQPPEPTGPWGAGAPSWKGRRRDGRRGSYTPSHPATVPVHPSPSGPTTQSRRSAKGGIR